MPHFSQAMETIPALNVRLNGVLGFCRIVVELPVAQNHDWRWTSK